MRLKPVELALVLALFVTFIFGGAINAEAAELSDKLIRLHVVAASDSPEDQALKLRVRDVVLGVIEAPLSGAASRRAASELLSANLGLIAGAAEKRIAEEGRSYSVSVSLEREWFPTTDYDDFSLPAGEYLSLRVVIGKGEGHNWWCVVFPRICFGGIVNAAGEKAVTDGDAELVTRSTGAAKVKFRAMELLGELKRFIASL